MYEGGLGCIVVVLGALPGIGEGLCGLVLLTPSDTVGMYYGGPCMARVMCSVGRHASLPAEADRSLEVADFAVTTISSAEEL